MKNDHYISGTTINHQRNLNRIYMAAVILLALLLLIDWSN